MVADVYVCDFSGGEQERVRRAGLRASERAMVRARYAQRVMSVAGVDEVTADLVMSALFDHYDVDGEPCRRGTHPTLPSVREHSHDLGFDCPCTWDAARRALEQRQLQALWEEWRTGPEALAHRAEQEAEDAEIGAWLGRHPDVEAVQVSWAAPEQWEGVIDGHSFYFRERGGTWHMELGLHPSGRVASKLIGAGEDGELLTEPVERRSGTVIAQGVESALGEAAVDHLAFIVGTVREHLVRQSCAHVGAGHFCPSCGAPSATTS